MKLVAPLAFGKVPVVGSTSWDEPAMYRTVGRCGSATNEKWIDPAPVMVPGGRAREVQLAPRSVDRNRPVSSSSGWPDAFVPPRTAAYRTVVPPEFWAVTSRRMEAARPVMVLLPVPLACDQVRPPSSVRN